MTPQELAVHARLSALGIVFERYEHPPVATADEADVHWAAIDAMHFKSLFLRNQKGTRHYLIIVRHPKRAELRAIADQLGDGKLSFASPERLMTSYMAKHLSDVLQTPDSEWTTFPGGELEGRRPRRLCPACRAKLQRDVAQPFRAASAVGALTRGATAEAQRAPLCFGCYRGRTPSSRGQGGRPSWRHHRHHQYHWEALAA